VRDARDQLVRVEVYRLLHGAEGEQYESAGVWTAKYDALNRRVEKNAFGKVTRFYWDSDRLIAEVGPSGALRVYAYADALAMTPFLFVDYASVEAAPESGRVYAVLANHLGCPEAIQDAEGRWVWTAQIEPYGQAVVDVGADFHQPLRWPGHYFDAELGLHYNRFRTYSPEIGRYLEPDPLGRGGGLENVYQYTINPLRTVDLRGLSTSCPVPPKKAPPQEPDAMPDEEEPEQSASAPEDDALRQKLDAAREAQERAANAADELPPKLEKKTVASNGHRTLSGSAGEPPPGFNRDGTDGESMLDYSQNQMTPSHNSPEQGAMDGDLPGSAAATHAEKQLAVQQMNGETNEPIGVSKEQCGDCRAWMQKQAQAQEQTIVVADPVYTRVYKPDGRVDVYDRDGDLVQQVPPGQPPSASLTKYPETLGQAVIDARRETIDSPDGWLTVANRNRVLAALGPSEKDERGQPLPSPGMMRRLRLGELCVQRVLPVWTEIVGTDGPERMLRAAHALVDGSIDRREARARFDDFGTALQYVYELPPERLHAAYVGFAAQGTLQIAKDDPWHVEETPDRQRDDWWDPFFCAAGAHALDLPWGKRFRPERFREFWLWMLEVALPVAYESRERWW
jgi:RHS repeat-associated protein